MADANQDKPKKKKIEAPPLVLSAPGMSAAARTLLGTMVVEFGPSACAVPSLCSTFVRRQFKAYPEESKLFQAAIAAGIVQPILEMPTDQDWASYSEPLVADLIEQKLKPDQARWVVDSWGLALGKHPDAPKQPP